LKPIKQVADLVFPTRWATFRLLAFEGVYHNKGTGEVETALALILGDIQGSPPLVRIHSQCTTGDVFHSLRCDCHDQLHLALKAIADQGTGVLVYEHQEGRGIGLIEKLRAYQLQDLGLDTVDANIRLGHAVDLRDYALSVGVLRFLKIESLQLMTNNPKKVDAVRLSGIDIVRRVSADVTGTPHCARYLATKREKLGHFSSSPATPVLLSTDAAQGTSLFTTGVAPAMSNSSTPESESHFD
jgi:GTP cyclohydrolase II